MSTLEVRNLAKTYGSGPGAHTALRDVSFDVADGELLSIVGPSGCGKTTLLKCVAGLVPPTSGTVRVLGSAVTGVPDGLAVVFQDYSRSLFPWMRVGRNVELPLRVLGLDRGERTHRVEESLAAMGLADKAERFPWELSGGMQQRVAIARALAYRPRVLLMDEPFASVDAQTRSGLEDLTRKVHLEFGMTILFVTHDIDESVYLADRVVILRRSPRRSPGRAGRRPARRAGSDQHEVHPELRQPTQHRGQVHPGGGAGRPGGIRLTRRHPEPIPTTQ